MPNSDRRYDDEYRPRPRRPRRDPNEDDYGDGPRGRRRPVAPQSSVLGILSLVQGIGGLVVSLIPCIGAIGLIGGAIGLLLGVIGLVLARKSDGEVGTGLPVAGIVVSVIGMVIGGVWLAIMGFAMSGVPAPGSNPVAAGGDDGTADAPALTLSAVELDRAYDPNEPAADAKYKGKWVEVVGRVQKVTGDTHPGKMTLELAGTEDSTVDCVFSNTQKAALAALRKGQEATVRGRCKGKVRSWVTLEDCTLVSKEPAVGKEKAADAGPPIQVTAAALGKEYGENVLAADAKFKGKVLEVTGEVIRVARSKPGRITVEVTDADAGWVIDCDFSSKEAAPLATLKAGQKVTIRGRCLGEIDEVLTLDGCSLVK